MMKAMAMMNIISADNNDNHTNENTCNIYICMIIPCQSKHFFSSLKLAARQFSMLQQIRKVCSKLVYIPVYHIPTFAFRVEKVAIRHCLLVKQIELDYFEMIPYTNHHSNDIVVSYPESMAVSTMEYSLPHILCLGSKRSRPRECHWLCKSPSVAWMGHGQLGR